MATSKRTAFVSITAAYQGTHARLGWLSSFSRKVLLGRHLVRWLSISGQDVLSGEDGKQRLLELFRICVTSQSLHEKAFELLSAGYEPSNRPEKYYLGVGRRLKKTLSVPISEGLVTSVEDGDGNFIAQTFPQDHMFTSTLEKVLDQETTSVSRSTNLSNKHIADERCCKLSLTPLWQNTLVHLDSDGWDFFSREMPTMGKCWSFWCQWYEGLFLGAPIEQELQLRVALIDDAIWQAGPEAVAEEIERIEANWLAEQLPQAEQIEFDLVQGQFQSKPIPLQAEELVETTLKQVSFARTVAAQSNCGLNSTSTAWLYIEHTLENCRDDPNAIEQNFEIARVDIVEGLADERYQQDAKLSALEQVLERAVTDLRANHPEVAQAWEIRIKHRLRVAKADQKQLIVEKTTELITVSNQELGDELRLDAKTIAESSGEVQGGAIKRFFGRVAQMRIIVRSGEVIKRIDASSGYKGTRIVQTLQSLVDLITGIFS